MKVRFILNTLEDNVRTAQEIWKGELEIPSGVLLMKVSVIAEGEPHPICDIPFSLTEGYWSWHSAEYEYGEDTERIGGNAFDHKGRRIQT